MNSFVKSVTILMLIGFCLVSKVAYANSGPTYWHSSPSSEIIAIDENCPIEIKSEKLLFNFADESKKDFAPRAEVTASYEMLNPTEQDLIVQMAFPFVTSLQNYSDANVLIKVDNKAVPFELYLGERVSNHGHASQQEKGSHQDFAQILKTITKQPYQGQLFSWDELGKLYTFKVKPTTEQGINFAIDFEFEPAKTRVLAKGFNRFEREGQEVRVAAWCYKPEVLELFVLGEDVDFNIVGYSDGELQEKSDLFSSEELRREESVKDYVTKYIEQRNSPLTGAENNQLYNLYGAALDEIFIDYGGFGTIEDLDAINFAERVFTLVFTTEFTAHAKHNVSVSYQASGTMDRTKTVNPVYTYTYLLNPAQNWSKFENLTIEIRTPEEAPFILDSNIDFGQKSDKHYIAKIEALPDSDLFFSLYKDEKISFMDSISSTLRNNYTILLLLCLVPTALLGSLIGGKLRKMLDKGW